MLMFLSSFYGIIDSKNRVAIPSSYRSTIKISKEKTYIFKVLTKLWLLLIIIKISGLEETNLKKRVNFTRRNSSKSLGWTLSSLTVLPISFAKSSKIATSTSSLELK